MVSFEEIVSKLAAQDGISIHAICNSKFIRSALLDKGLKLPKDESMIMALVHHQSDIFKEEIRQELVQKREKLTVCAFHLMNLLLLRTGDTCM